MSLDQSGIPQNSQVMGDMWLGTAEDLRQVGYTFFAEQEGFQNAQTRFIAHGLQDGGTLARGGEVGGAVAWHQQQFPSGEQLTASPSTTFEFRW